MKKYIPLCISLLLSSTSILAQTDTIPPVLVCRDTFTIDIIFDNLECMSRASLHQLVLDASDNSGTVQLGLRRPCMGSGFPLDTTAVFTSDDVGIKTVEIWARDSAENYSSCTSKVVLNGGYGGCDPSGWAIQCQNHEDFGIINIQAQILAYNCLGDTVRMTGPYGPGTDPNFWSNHIDGTLTYRWYIAPEAGYTVEIVPFRNDNPLNGVTTYDLTLINKHILGLEPLNSPYKMLAADINQDGNITTFDVLLLRKLILGLIPNLPHGKAWRFMPKSFVFPNLANPFASPVPDKLISPNTNWPSINFYEFRGIKIGDVNNSAIPD
ncbi:MAG: hypothetical protein J0M29_15785 [Chitinophagales bacterium]|nr:hypothetical protein [Chitinophagales bacterium]